MRKAGLVVWKAHEAVTSTIAPGVTTGELDAIVEKVFEINNSTPLFKGVPGRVPFPAATCISINEEVVHGIPENGGFWRATSSVSIPEPG